MAKPSSAHPPSRQGQEGATAARTTRSTRSQSRDRSEPPAASASPKKERSKKTTQLNTVNENVTIEEQLAAGLSAAAAAEEDAGLPRRTSANSGMSGTTAKTSFSQEEVDGLDADIIVDVLPSTSSAADDLCKLLVPVNPKSRPVIRKEIRTANSKDNKLFNIRVAALDLNKHHFGSTEYIQPTRVLRALFAVQSFADVPQGPWRPDHILYRINLARMLRTVLISVPDNVEISPEGYNAMENLDGNFASAIAGPEFDLSAFQLVLSLLTQLAIIRCSFYSADPKFSARQIVMDTFYVMDDDGDHVFRHRNVLHMLDTSVTDQTNYSQMIRQLNDQLASAFETTDTMAALGALRAQYPWEAFVEYVTHYYLKRKQELDEQIASRGGIDQIAVGLAGEVEKRADARAAEVKRQSFSRPGGTPKKSFGKGGIRALKAREKQLAANAPPPPATAPSAVAPVAQMVEEPAIHPDLTNAAAVPQDDGFIRQEDEDEASSKLQSTARQSYAALLNPRASKQNASKGKGRFNERQPGAERITFDDGASQLTQYRIPENFEYPSSSAPVQQGPYYPPIPRPAKRVYEDDNEPNEPEEFDPTQDQGFEVDRRDTAAADQRRRNAPQGAPQQPRFSSSAGPSMHVTSSAPTYPSPSKRARKNPGSTIPALPAPFDPDDERPLSTAEHWQRSKLAARHNTVMANFHKPSQVRTPWTEQEELALINLIETEGAQGVHYAKLKATDDERGEAAELSRRSAEDFRFKARNMKEAFLKGRSVLPRNFEFVVLDKKAINKLTNLGIAYDQERIRGAGAVIEIDME